MNAVVKTRSRLGLSDDNVQLDAGGSGATAYAQAVGVYLAFGASRASDAWSSLVTWRNQLEASRNTFARQALPMTWDFTEVNPFSTHAEIGPGNSNEWVQKSLHFEVLSRESRLRQMLNRSRFHFRR